MRPGPRVVASINRCDGARHDVGVITFTYELVWLLVEELGFDFEHRSVLMEKRRYRTVNPDPETSEFSSVGTCKKYRRTFCSGDASRRKIMKNMTYRVLDPGFTMHA